MKVQISVAMAKRRWRQLASQTFYSAATVIAHDRLLYHHVRAARGRSSFRFLAQVSNEESISSPQTPH